MASTENQGSASGTEPTPMFQLSQPDAEAGVGLSGVDLDDLFVDCYFADVPGLVESGNVSASAQVPTVVGGTSTAQAPVPESTLSAPTTHVIAAPQAATLPTATPVAATPAAPAIPVAPAPTPQTSTAHTSAPTALPVAQPTSVPIAPTTRPASTSTAVKMEPSVASKPPATEKKRSAEQSGLDKSGDSGDGKDLTDKQKLERRERNREHAKRSRLRKKFLLESLQEQIHGLQEQMEKLKDALKREVPAKADGIINDICGSKENYTPLPMPSGFGPVKTLMEPDFRLMTALSGSQQNFAISDPTLPDNPIVYVSQGFLDLTGYTLDQVLGRNCRFLQGPGTDQSAVDVIRGGIAEGVDTSVCLLNYKADGTPFWNQVFVAALRDAENNVVNFVGVQCEVSKAVVEKHMGDKKKPST